MSKTRSQAANHIHRYRKVNIGSKDNPYFVFKCVKPACSHYIPVRLAEGAMCECNRCHEPMIIGKLQLTGSNNKAMTFPHCGSCTKSKKAANVATISKFLEENEI